MDVDAELDALSERLLHGSDGGGDVRRKQTVGLVRLKRDALPLN